jgi:tRNA (adenine22-N1)-methyltransferase
VADVGTDHGILPRALLASGRASHCVASDVAGQAIQRARERAESGRLPDRLELRRGLGLKVLTPADRIDVVVLSGMGARTILSVLEGGRARDLRIRRLVIQPQSEPARVRRWLFDRGWRIVAERIVRERRRFYVAIAAEPAGARVAADPLPFDRELAEQAGPCLLVSGDPLVREYWAKTLREQQRILDLAEAGHGREEAERRRQLAFRVLEILDAPSGMPRDG